MFVGFNFKNGQYGEGLKFLKFHREANQDQKTPCDIPYKKNPKSPKNSSIKALYLRFCMRD
jgi:hypothetical protein